MKQTFEQWMAQVNRFMDALCGMGADDLPDYHYRDSYNDGYAPLRVAKAAVRAARDDSF